MYSVEGRSTDMDFFLVGEGAYKILLCRFHRRYHLAFLIACLHIINETTFVPKGLKTEPSLQQLQQIQESIQVPPTYQSYPGISQVPFLGGGGVLSHVWGKKGNHPPPPTYPQKGPVPEIPTPKKIWDQRYPPLPPK